MTDADHRHLHVAWARAVEALMLADEQRAIAARAEAVGEAKTRFMAAMAHELKNPVNAISGYAQFLRLMPVDERNVDSDRCLDSIDTASKHLAGIIDDTLLAARLDAGKAPVELADLDFRKLMDDLDKILRPQIEAGGNRFEMSLDPDIGVIVSDPTKVRQILINLLSNSAKFTKDGVVSLQISRRDAGHILLRVQDTGAGMTPDQLSHLFEAFTSIGGRHSSELGGTGLGMFITKNLCHLLASEISVLSTPGGGTCFEIILSIRLEPNLVVARPPRDRILTIAVREGLPHSDPHLNATEIDFYCAQHMFEGLTALDRDGQIQPALASVWRRVDPLVWEFDLKPGVTFHDGSPFEAEDVLASFERLRHLARGELNNNQILATVASAAALGPRRVKITTSTPHRSLPLDLVEFHIIHRRFATATTLDFDVGTATIGTGPFRQLERSAVELRLEAFADYHGDKTDWLEVDFRYVRTREEMSTKLRRGEIDVVYALPSDWRSDYSSSGRQMGDARLTVGVASHPGLMLCFMAPSFLPRLAGGCKDANGRALEQNPLLDERVRHALSLGIDRRFICEVLLGGTGTPAGGLVPPLVKGANPDLTADPFNPARAKALLTEAGFADGLIIEAAYSDDVPTYQLRGLRAIEIMLAGIGIMIQWHVLPRSVLHDHSNAPEYGLKYQYWTCSTGDALYNLQHLVATPSDASGYGATNFGRYSSALVDELIVAADRAESDAGRASALRAAAALAIADRAILPLYYPDACWAYRTGYKPLRNAQAATLAKWIVRA